MIKKRIPGTGLTIFLALAFLGFPSPSVAGNPDIELGTLVQKEFEELSIQVGITIGHVPLSPAEPLGILGFDVGIEITVIDIDDAELFWTNGVEDGDPPGIIFLPKIHAQKGLPFGIDAGLTYAKAPGSNIALFGADLKWAFLRGGITMPAVAVRTAYSRLLGVDDIDLDTYYADLSISKGLGFITPYAGVGQLWINSRSDLFENHSDSVTKGFAGVKVTIVMVSFVAEVDITEIPLYSFRANLSF